MPRILAMLDRHQIPATFFVTGVDAMLHPDMLAAIQKSGRHEIGVHGWIHEFTPRLTDGEEERLLDRAIEYLTKVTGKRPVGYRAPSWAFSMATLDLILKKGFLYDSSLQALDEPYEIMSRGKNTGLVELAIDWTLTETPYLGQNGRMPSPELLYQLYKDEFDGAYDERTMFVLTLHPYLSGHRAPMRHLEQFVAYMKSKPGVWFATAERNRAVCQGGSTVVRATERLSSCPLGSTLSYTRGDARHESGREHFRRLGVPTATRWHRVPLATHICGEGDTLLQRRPVLADPQRCCERRRVDHRRDLPCARSTRASSKMHLGGRTRVPHLQQTLC